MADREDLLNELTGNAPAADDTTAEAPPPADDPVLEDQPDAEQQPDAPAPDAEAGALSGQSAAELLDALTVGAEAKKPDAAASGEPTPDPAAAATPKTEEPAAPKTLDEQEAEALEGIKSERGRARIQAVFAERRELEAKSQKLENDINEFREMVKSTGASPDDFAQTLQFLRLANANDEQSARAALEMIEMQRAELCKRLGIDAPGVDVLAEFPDLKVDVHNGMPMERALEMAKYRRQQMQVEQARQVQEAQQRDMANWQSTVKNVEQTAVAYFQTREKEADFPVKLAQLKAHFSNPENMNRFLDANPDPKQWFGALQFMYDAIKVAPAPRPNTAAQPIRTRPTMAGTPQSDANAPLANRIMGHLDALGL